MLEKGLHYFFCYKFRINSATNSITSSLIMYNIDFSCSTTFRIQGPTFEQVSQTRKQKLSPAMLAYYKKPVLVHQGHKQWLFDHDGKRYLDLFAGIVTVSVGHCHP